MWSNCCPLKIACDRSSFFFAFGNRKECMMREPPFNLDIAWKSRELPASSSLFLLKWGQGGQKPHRWRCLAFAGKKFSLSHDMITLMGFWAFKFLFVWSGLQMLTWGSHCNFGTTSLLITFPSEMRSRGSEATQMKMFGVCRKEILSISWYDNTYGGLGLFVAVCLI